MSTGLDHLAELGLTHVHLLPTNDEDIAWIAASMRLVCQGPTSCALRSLISALPGLSLRW